MKDKMQKGSITELGNMQKGPITKLGKILEDPEALQGVGRKLVRQAIENSVGEKLGRKMSNPQVTQVIRKGEVVPSFFVDKPGLKIRKGIATSECEWSWLDLWVWQRSWGECDPETVVPPPIDWNDPKLQTELMSVLTRGELEVVEKL